MSPQFRTVLEFHAVTPLTHGQTAMFLTKMAMMDSADCQTIVNALPEAALVIDHVNTVVAANRLAEVLLEGKLVGTPAGFFMRSPAVLTGIKEARYSEKTTEVEFELRGRITRSFNVHLSPMGANEIGPMVLALIRDRTREEQIERMRSDFVANVSHELRTPLTSLLGFIETMQGAASKDEKAREQFLGLMKARSRPHVEAH